jgi:hypothetical protein
MDNRCRIWYTTKLDEDTGSYRARPQFVIKISRGTLKVKKEDRWKRYRWGAV